MVKLTENRTLITDIITGKVYMFQSSRSEFAASAMQMDSDQSNLYRYHSTKEQK